MDIMLDLSPMRDRRHSQRKHIVIERNKKELLDVLNKYSIAELDQNRWLVEIGNLAEARQVASKPN